MARAPLKFKQSDYVRAVKAARAVGLEVVRSEIAPDGRIVLIHQNDNTPPLVGEFDQWKAKRDARSA